MLGTSPADDGQCCVQKVRPPDPPPARVRRPQRLLSAPLQHTHTPATHGHTASHPKTPAHAPPVAPHAQTHRPTHTHAPHKPLFASDQHRVLRQLRGLLPRRRAVAGVHLHALQGVHHRV